MLAELHAKYVTAKSPAWRAKTETNERARWKYFAERIGPHTFADLITPEALDEFTGFLLAKGGAKGQPIAPNQVRAIVGNVVRVFRWGRKRRLLAENALAEYAVPLGKDARALDVAEYPPDETAALMRRFSPRDAYRWRAWVALTIAANQGARVNAILRLEHADCDTTAKRIRWRSESDKLGRERWQPMTRDTVRAVRYARCWRRCIGYEGRWLIPAAKITRRAKDLPWGYSGLHRLLTVAEVEAGVPHRPRRALHGFRRMVARNALEVSGGDLNLAAEYIGDTDLRTFKRSYMKERGESLDRIAAGLGTPIQTPPEGASATSSVRQSTPQGGA